mmetsp:Transcript_1276/g.4727  ORF Transcript_1276/g.4727 Transcript_1276/m.4727 type:complete len:90 (-) Transcript_1276:113-382(-)
MGVRLQKGVAERAHGIGRDIVAVDFGAGESPAAAAPIAARVRLIDAEAPAGAPENRNALVEATMKGLEEQAQAANGAGSIRTQGVSSAI